jgi:hypothetical protein
MRRIFCKIGVSVAALLLSTAMLSTAGFAAAAHSYMGRVSDSMCGAKHQMANATECTRACVKHGAKYALVVGDKVYTLETKSKASEEKLYELAGKRAKVRGMAHGDTIEVSSVSVP